MRADVPVLTNPYEIAYLRGGASEAIRVAVIGLIERGVLVADDKEVVRSTDGFEPAITDPFERKIAEWFDIRGVAETVANSDHLKELLLPIKARLENEGLAINEEQSALRNWLIAAVLSSLWIVSMTKIAIALGHGKHNILILIILTVIGKIVAMTALYRQDRTVAGDAALRGLRVFHRTELGLNPSGNEMLMYAAVFGACAAPVLANPYQRAPGEGGGSVDGCGSGDGGGGGCGGCGGD